MGVFAEDGTGKGNPFDFGPAAGGVSPELTTAFDTARAEWLAHNKVLLGETVAALDREIGRVNSYAAVIQKVLDIVQQVIAQTTTTAGSTQKMTVTNELASALSQVQTLATNLQNVRNGVPFLGNLVSRLVGAIKVG